METALIAADLSRELGAMFTLEEGHRIRGHYARNGYPEYDDRLIPAGTYQVDAQWANQLMVSEVQGDGGQTTKHRYVIVQEY